LLEAPGEFAIFAARSFDMPFFFNASYCFSFFTCALLPGIELLLTRFDQCGLPLTRLRKHISVIGFGGFLKRPLSSSRPS
jgi:hypothetical protein